MINIVVPMAGHGSRFSKAGYTDPKPLIPVFGRPMIEWVIENIKPSRPHRFVFLCQAEHLSHRDLRPLLERLAPGCRIVPVDRVTDGAACTVLLAKDFIDNDDPLMIVNCDQYVDVSIDDYLRAQDVPGVDGLIMTMKAHDDKWSFIELNDRDEITRLVEKEVVSDEATVGIYNFRRGRDFVAAAQSMIAKNLRINGEFYVAPAYNEMIAGGSRLAYFNIGTLGRGMHGLGTPQDLKDFIARHPQGR